MFRRPLTLISIVVVLFVLGGILRLSTPTKPDSTHHLDPAKYRAQIEPLERLLYAESTPDMADFVAISAAMNRLGSAIMERERSPFVRDQGFELMALASRSDIGEGGYALPSMANVRSEWEAQRARTFGTAEWFRQSTPEIEEAQAPSRPVVEPRTLDGMRRSIDALEDLIDEGRRRCAELGEPDYDAEFPGAEGMKHVAAWNEFALEWERDLNDAAGRLPAHPGWSVDPEVTYAYQEITNAFHELRVVPVGVGDWSVPFEYQWTQRFDAAQHLLEKARSRLSAMQ